MNFHYPPSHHCGVIVLRIRPKTMDKVHAMLQRLLETMTQEEMQGALAIVDAVKYRVRRG